MEYPSEESYYQSIGSGSYFCMACGYKSDRSNMRKHVQRKHLESKVYPCTLCDKGLKSEYDRKTHYVRAHGLHLSLQEIANLKKLPNL